MANEVTINGINYSKVENKLYNDFKIRNSYEISASVPTGSAFDEQKPEWKIYKDMITISASASDITTYFTDELVKQNYLDDYSNTIKKFILAGKQSVYLRTTAVTGSDSLNASISGSDLFNQSPFFDLPDIQQLKEYSSNIFTADPCLLMDTDNINAPIKPIKLALVRINFRLLCRTIVTTMKLQNIFLTSIFNNEEFYKSGNYYDSTLIDYAFEILLQKLQLLIPQYKKSIYVYLTHELEKKLSDGEELLDPITNEKIEFETPLDDTNKISNIEKYIKMIFKEEFMFVTDKTNILFNSSGSDPANSASYYFAPSSTFGTNKLYTAKEYFIESLPAEVLYTSNTSSVREVVFNGSGYNVDSSTTAVSEKEKFFLELSSSQNLTTNKITTYLNFKQRYSLGEDAGDIQVNLFTVKKVNNLAGTELTDLVLREFMKARLPALKQQLLTDQTFLLFTNYVFPVNKILNIASLFYINMSLKLYQNLNDITRGSIKAISSIHDSILGNDQDCDTPGLDFNLDDMILGMSLEILKAIALTPILILKSIEETYDKNIFIATKLRSLAELAGAPKLPIIPYSAAVMIPKPYSFELCQ